MITEYLKQNNLIICPNNLKKRIIREINNNQKLIAFKVMDLQEFLNNYFFTYDKKTIFYIMCKYKVKYEIALEYLNSLYYIENKNYLSLKLNNLVKLKQDLLDKDLLTINNNFLYYLNNVNIIICGIELDPFLINIFNKWEYAVVDYHYEKKNINVLEFLNIEDEIGYIISDIKSKLDNGISIDKIKIVSGGSEYTNVFKRLFNWANIPLDLNEKISLYNLEFTKKIINMLKDNYSFSDIITNLNNIDDSYINKIVNIFNNYVDFNIETSRLVDMIIYDLKNSYVKSKHLKNSIKVISLEEIENDDFTYLVGFNKENYPKIYKDEEFLSDDMKNELGLFTSNQRNNYELNKLRNYVYNNNLIITYKLKTSFDNYNPCILIDEDNMNVLKNNRISYNFSHFFNKFNLAKGYDNFYKYGIINDDLKMLDSNYKNLEYDTYDNKFTGVDNNTYLNSINKLTLSYSSIDSFFRCSFRYYLSNVLRIHEDNTDDFYINIGNIFHYVLSKYRESDFSFDKSWNEEANKYTFTLDKLILLEKLKEELKFDLEIIRKQENYTNMHEYLFEKRFTVPITNLKNKDVYFTGVVDKIIYDYVDNKNIVSIIDYKTGTLPSNLNNVIYGIGMQLPIYMFFIKRSNLFPNLEIAGFYLQKIINKDVKRTLNKTLDELKENSLKLVGYSNCSSDIISVFDTTYHDSGLISGLKQKNDGSFYNYSKVLSDKELNKLDNIVSSRINDGASRILDGDFIINPKKVDKDYIGCEFCSYRDICFKKENDYVELEKYNNLEFLRGDEDA